MPRGRKVEIEPRMHVDVASFAPIKTRMREHDLRSADEQGEESRGRDPVSYAHQRGMAFWLRGNGCGYRSLSRAALGDRHSCVHDVPNPFVHGILHREGRSAWISSWVGSLRLNLCQPACRSGCGFDDLAAGSFHFAFPCAPVDRLRWGGISI